MPEEKSSGIIFKKGNTPKAVAFGVFNFKKRYYLKITIDLTCASFV